MATEGNFFSRWSKRKAEVRGGLASDDPPRVLPLEAGPPIDPSQTPVSPAPVAPPRQEEPSACADGDAQGTAEAEKNLTLEDVDALTTESDFSPFVEQQVDPDVRNAALKKLFTDPHFNEIDGLDVYLDDYSKPDPLPVSLARKLVSSQFMKLFDESPDNEPQPQPSLEASPPVPAVDGTPIDPEPEHEPQEPGPHPTTPT